MKTVGLVALALALGVPASPLDVDPPAREPGLQLAVTCSKIKEQFTGRRKICYYDCMGTTRAISIPAIQDCPLSIER